MPTLDPTPSTLGLASPALGPWFRHDTPANTPPTLPIPDGDLSCTVSLVQNMEWRAPASATRSYFIATGSRPADLRTLRQTDGSTAFTTGNLVVLLTLLPEVELRLWTLTQPVRQSDNGAAPPANTPTRPRVRYLAAEIDAALVGSINDLQNLRPEDLPSDLSDDVARAAFLGLTFSGGNFGNAATPVSELCRPAKSSAVAIKNRKPAPLSVKLWCFDHRGRPLDPGGVAALWAHMASPAIWDNLWAHSDVADQRTADIAPGRFIHLTSAHEGPLAGELAARLNLTDLTQIGSDYLYQTGTAPAIALTAAANLNTDTAPIPRLAVLPNGAFADPASATPFAGWTDAGDPFPLTRDFARVALIDIEAHLVGLTRADTVQQDPRRRVSAFRNTTANAMLLSTDTVATQAMTVLSNGASAIAMASVMDTRWGGRVPATLSSDPLTAPAFDVLNFTVHAIAGEGTQTGGTAADQRVVFKFDATTLPPDTWLRIWPHGRDTTTGRRVRLDGGAGLADSSGTALIVVPIPDGTASDATKPTQLSFDALLVSADATRLYADQRYDRPVIVAGARLGLPADGSTPAGISLFAPSLGTVLSRGTGAVSAGEPLLAFQGPLTNNAFQLIDPDTLLPNDLNVATLPNAAEAGDTLITTSPAFGQTPEGTLSETATAGGPARVHRSRNGLVQVTSFGQPVPSQERLELAALERTTNTGVVGATPGRERHHEVPPPRLAHAGVPAAEEIHGPGVALAGPATDPLVPILRERVSTDLADFIGRAGVPAPAVTDPGGTSTWSAVLETLTNGMAGDATLRAMMALAPSFMPGQTWTQIKSRIDSALSSLGLGNLDSLIDTSTFDDDTLAAAVDRVLYKTQSGLHDFATAATAAIDRAEDFVYIQTPALDPHPAGGGAIDLIGRIRNRWNSRPGLVVMLCVPERWLPDVTAKIEELRKFGIGGAMKALQDDAPDRVVLFSPIAGSGRPLHMAATTVIVDDAILLSGTTHLSRRGLTFDSSLAVSVFDETNQFGRSQAVRTARLQLLATMLGMDATLIPDDPEDCFDALVQMNAGGGLGRVKPGLYAPKDDPTTAGDLDAWNPDGRALQNWLTFFAALTGPVATELSNAIR